MTRLDDVGALVDDNLFERDILIATKRLGSSPNITERTQGKKTCSLIFLGQFHRRPGAFGLGGRDFLVRKNYLMPKRVGVEIGMQMQTSPFSHLTKTAIVGKKKAQLKVFPFAFCTNKALTIRAIFSIQFLQRFSVTRDLQRKNSLAKTQAAQAQNTRSYMFFFFYLYANAQRNVTWGIYYCLTIELDLAKRDSRLTAYGGVVLQRLEGLNL